MAALWGALWGVVESRGDVGPFLSLLRRDLARLVAALPIKTWHLERATLAALLAVVAWVQHHEVLLSLPSGGSPAFLQVCLLVLAFVGLLMNAEDQSIQAREREEAEACGVEPVEVECSAQRRRNAEFRRWASLATIAATSGWVALVGWAWGVAYPHWRAYYRARWPVGRVQWRPVVVDSAVACLEMLTGHAQWAIALTLDRWGGQRDAFGFLLYLQTEKQSVELTQRPGWPVTATAFLELPVGRWALWDNGRVHCPVHGVLRREEAVSLWAAEGLDVLGHYVVIPRVVVRYDKVPVGLTGPVLGTG
ncbi:hypothetical protein QEG98_42070 (plasmid) [Myxococcus sp. MxC21-1]|uniref:hypothetical protein n=1 Tax=Myxococcus sp. MxC21-1 TaxID=3041439 RepID=UPI00292DB90C|nr:hypothetical protein [Myxococcus sp. MxC21-1]WNZ66208.1 hypothetical protein QEG98_42070 [Myxococcus sp. MxC21-1]